MVNINEMHFSMDAIFIAHQLQEKYITAKKPLYFAYPHDSDYNPDLD